MAQGLAICSRSRLLREILTFMITKFPRSVSEQLNKIEINYLPREIHLLMTFKLSTFSNFPLPHCWEDIEVVATDT